MAAQRISPADLGCSEDLAAKTWLQKARAMTKRKAGTIGEAYCPEWKKRQTKTFVSTMHLNNMWRHVTGRGMAQAKITHSC